MPAACQKSPPGAVFVYIIEFVFKLADTEMVCTDTDAAADTLTATYIHIFVHSVQPYHVRAYVYPSSTTVFHVIPMYLRVLSWGRLIMKQYDTQNFDFSNMICERYKLHFKTWLSLFMYICTCKVRQLINMNQTALDILKHGRNYPMSIHHLLA